MPTEATNYQISAIEALARLEESMSRFYEACSQAFQKTEGDWHALAMLQLSHASWIRNLHHKISDGTVDFAENRFSLKETEELIARIDKERQVVADGKMQFSDALALAIGFERDVCGGRLFEEKENDPQDLQILLRMMRSSADQRFNALKELICSC